MTVAATMRHLGGVNCSNIDNVYIISMTSNFKVWVDRGKEFKINESEETLEYKDKTSGLKHVIDITDIDMITMHTEESKSEYRQHLI